MRYNGIEWALRNLSVQFDAALLTECSVVRYGVMWEDGLHELYCMGGPLDNEVAV